MLSHFQEEVVMFMECDKEQQMLREMFEIFKKYEDKPMTIKSDPEHTKLLKKICERAIEEKPTIFVSDKNVVVIKCPYCKGTLSMNKVYKDHCVRCGKRIDWDIEIPNKRLQLVSGKYIEIPREISSKSVN